MLVSTYTRFNIGRSKTLPLIQHALDDDHDGQVIHDYTVTALRRQQGRPFRPVVVGLERPT
jgi:hypothetical protein